MSPKETGKYIAKLRKERGLTQSKLAEKLKVSDKAVSRWETGKGYPDIATLSSIAEFFGISVNELLEGKEIPPENVIVVADQNVKSVMKTGEKRKKINKALIIGIACISLAFLIQIIPFVYYSAQFVGSVIMSYKYGGFSLADENCIISEDYNKITYYGNTYVPLKIENLSYNQGKVLVEKAKVENYGWFEEFFMQDIVYTVEGCKNHELLHLFTDYDLNESDLYCLESKVQYYKELIDSFESTTYYSRPGDVFETLMPLDYEDFIEEVINGDSLSVSDVTRNDMIYTQDSVFKYENNWYSVPVISYDEYGIFFYIEGEIYLKDEVYYWSDGSDYTTYTDVDSLLYLIPEKYYNMLDIILECEIKSH